MVELIPACPWRRKHATLAFGEKTVRFRHIPAPRAFAVAVGLLQVVLRVAAALAKGAAGGRSPAPPSYSHPRARCGVTKDRGAAFSGLLQGRNGP